MLLNGLQQNGPCAGSKMIENPFKHIESDTECPGHIKTELVSEIDMIRNTLQIVELYAGDLFNVLSIVASLPTNSSDNKLP